MKREEVPSQNESIEKGRNVRIVLKFIRHGERTKENALTDLGREVTTRKAKESGIMPGEFDAVKPLGSNVDPRIIETPVRGRVKKMGRSLETADIYAKEIAGFGARIARPRDVLNYMKLRSPLPFDYKTLYDSNLPQNFDDLPPLEQSAASKKAQTAVAQHLTGLHTPEAEAYKHEVAGAFAAYIVRTERVAKRLSSGKKVLEPSGTHGGMIEPFLQQALVRREGDGPETRGFERLEEIGGEFDPSESFDVEVTTDANGNLGPLRLKWEAGSRRPATPEMYLDSDKVKELAAYYEELHPKE